MRNTIDFCTLIFIVSLLSARKSRRLNGERIVFSTNRAGIVGYPYAEE